MRPFTELRTWRAGHELTLEVYQVTASFPADERFGLTAQMRRAAASVPTNIAEGSARTDQEFHHFLQIALGSSAELEYQFILARDLGYLPSADYERLVADVGALKRMIVRFMSTVSRGANGQRPTAISERSRSR
jgi:four helix bundle protein